LKWIDEVLPELRLQYMPRSPWQERGEKMVARMTSRKADAKEATHQALTEVLGSCITNLTHMGEDLMIRPPHTQQAFLERF